MEQHKFRVEVGEYIGGTWYTSTSQQFDTVIFCNNPNDGLRMLEAQWGGPDKARVSYMGLA